MLVEALLFVLLIGLGVWQLISVRRDERRAQEAKRAKEDGSPTA